VLGCPHWRQQQWKPTNGKRQHQQISGLILLNPKYSKYWNWLERPVRATFHHGLRVTEVLQLRLTDSINWKDRTITVARLKGSMTTTQPLVEMRGKPALNELAALKAYLKERIEDGSGRLFTGQKGQLQRWTLTRMFADYCEKVSAARVDRGLAPIAENARHFHVIKHTLATILASRVDNIFLVKTQLGHAAISSTMHYCHPDAKLAAIKSKEVLTQVFA
jgi:integrase